MEERPHDHEDVPEEDAVSCRDGGLGVVAAAGVAVLSLDLLLDLDQAELSSSKDSTLHAISAHARACTPSSANRRGKQGQRQGPWFSLASDAVRTAITWPPWAS